MNSQNDSVFCKFLDFAMKNHYIFVQWHEDQFPDVRFWQGHRMSLDVFSTAKFWSFFRISSGWAADNLDRLQRIIPHQIARIFQYVVLSQLVTNYAACMEDIFKEFLIRRLHLKVGMFVVSDFGSLKMLPTLLLDPAELLLLNNY